MYLEDLLACLLPGEVAPIMDQLPLRRPGEAPHAGILPLSWPGGSWRGYE